MRLSRYPASTRCGRSHRAALLVLGIGLAGLGSAEFASPTIAEVQCHRGAYSTICAEVGPPPVTVQPPVQQGPSEEQLRHTAAQAKYDAALQLWNDPNAHEKDWDFIISLIDEALRLWPENASYAKNLQTALNNRQNAIIRRQNAITAEEERQRYAAFVSSFEAGRQAYREGRWADAARSYEEALVYRPLDPATQFNLRLAQDHLAKIAAVPDVAAAATRRAREVLAEPIEGTRGPWNNATRELADLEAAVAVMNVVDDTALSHRERIEAAVQILAAPWFIRNPALADKFQREVYLKHVKTELKDMLQQTLATSTALMAHDVRKLEPFKWDPFGAEQREVIARTEQDLLATRKQAESDIASDDIFREVVTEHGEAIEFRSSPALRQLRKAQLTILWEGR
jgi:hypothetical protein